MPKIPPHSNYRRGVASIITLALLSKEDMYGYQLVQQIKEQSGGRIITQEGSLYPVLYKLMEMGYITDHRVQSGKRMTRIYYHIEPSGREYLKELIEDYRAVTQGVLDILSSGGFDVL